jgi:site-specific DNA recombinase
MTAPPAPIYVDKLDEIETAAFFDQMSRQWREEQNCCLREIEDHQEADHSYLDEGVQLLELAQNAQRLFAKQDPREKRGPKLQKLRLGWGTRIRT